MNCANHPELSATAFCRGCGKALCPSCQQTAQGAIYCAEHAAVYAAAPPPSGSPYTAPPTVPGPAPSPNLSVSPGLAFLLGLIPGVGAIYNAQYAKGLINVIIFGGLISLTASDVAREVDPLFPFMLAGWYFYMPFEAFHTAKKRQLGETVDEFSSLVPLRRSGFPLAPVLLIAFGILFLMINFGYVHFRELFRYWPVFPIILGVYLLFVRLTAPAAPDREAVNEHR